MEVLKRGAEAIIYREGDRVIKQRIRKGYRHPELDLRIRRMRTRREARLLVRSRQIGVRVPKVLEVDEESFTIVMEYIRGRVLRDVLREEGRVDVMGEMGRVVGILHSHNIVHGDLTTSNAILSGGGLYLIDFGLGEVSGRVEDKAVDLVCFEKSYFATHSDLPEGWDWFLDGYSRAYADWRAVVRRAVEVKRRARYL